MPRRLLLVEDEVPVQELLAEYLRGRGFEVEVCSDGASAFSALTAGKFELLVTDLRLPDAEGLEIVEAAWALDPPLPSLVTSGFATVEAAVVALTTGAVDVLLKPFRLRDAHAAVQRALARIASQRDTSFRLALLGWYERLTTAPDVDAALADLLRVVALHRPEVRIEVVDAELDGGARVGDGVALGPGCTIRADGEHLALLPAFAALNALGRRG